MQVLGNGIVKLRYDHRFDDPKVQEWVSYEIDSSHGVHLLSEEHFQKEVSGPHSEQMSRQELKWKQYGDEWYVQEASKQTRGVARASEEELKTRKPYAEERKTRILEFRPNDGIDPNEFELSGMGVKRGANVRDIIIGVEYRYGGEVALEEDLAAALADGELYKRMRPEGAISSRPASKAAGGTTVNAVKDGRAGPAKTAAKGGESWVWTAWIVIGAVAISLVCIVAIALARRASRGRKR